MLVNVDIHHIVSPNYWYNGSYIPLVDCRRLTAVANTLRALVLGGVHSTVASRANVLATNV